MCLQPHQGQNTECKLLASGPLPSRAVLCLLACARHVAKLLVFGFSRLPCQMCVSWSWSVCASTSSQSFSTASTSSSASSHSGETSWERLCHRLCHRQHFDFRLQAGCWSLGHVLALQARQGGVPTSHAYPARCANCARQTSFSLTVWVPVACCLPLHSCVFGVLQQCPDRDHCGAAGQGCGQACG